MSKSENVEKVAHLACLELGTEEAINFQKNFDKVLSYFETLNELDTSDIRPMVTPHEMTPALRRDEVHRDLSVEQVLGNAPDLKDSLFRVPPVV